MGTWQVVWVVLACTGLLLSANKHGKDKEGRHNFYIDAIANGLGFMILYFGGFFR